MNAGADFNVRLNKSVYQAIFDIMEDDYDAWIEMDSRELMGKVMKQLRGHVNPKMVDQIIGSL